MYNHNFILGSRYLGDTTMFIDALINIFRDEQFNWSSPEPIFNILVDTPIFLFDQLGLKTQITTGSPTQSSFGIYSMSYFREIVFYKPEVDSELYLYLFCIVFEIESTVDIQISYVLQCLSPWDARMKPSFF